MEEQSYKKRIRRSFDKDFKISAVRMVIEGKEPIRKVAGDLGISENTLHNWKKAYLKNKEQSFPGKGYQTSEEAEITKLKKENALLKEQRDILKKAVTFFSQQGK